MPIIYKYPISEWLQNTNKLDKNFGKIVRQFISNDGFIGIAAEIECEEWLLYNYRASLQFGEFKLSGSCGSLSEAQSICDSYFIDNGFQILGPIMRAQK